MEDISIKLPAEGTEGQEELKAMGHASGKNIIFQALFGHMQYLTDVVDLKHKIRIVIDYDPDEVNWRMEVFTDKDAPTPEGIR